MAIFVNNLLQGIYWFVYLESQKDWLQTQLNAGIKKPRPGLAQLCGLLHSQIYSSFITAEQQKGLQIAHVTALHLLKRVSICSSELDSHWLELAHMGIAEQTTGRRAKGSAE